MENSTPSNAESGNNHVYCGPHWIVTPCILHHEMGNELLPIGPGQPVFTRPHRIKQLTNYRLWNPVSRQNDGLIRRDVSSNTVTCNGSFNGGKDSKLLHQYYVQNKVKVTYYTLLFTPTSVVYLLFTLSVR